MPTLDWIGKQAVRDYHRQVPCLPLKHDRQLSVGRGAENLLVEGDNLLALKALLPAHAGQVDCIYIDPPYNTGAEHWVYNDNLSHDQWLCMMYPRLALLQDFLTSNGVLFISIDDHEVHALRYLVEEFPALRFVGCIVWERKRKGSHLSKQLTQKTEYVLVYARRTADVQLFGQSAGIDEDFPLLKRTNREKMLVVPAEALEPTPLPDGLYAAGTYGSGGTAVELLEAVAIAGGHFQGPLKLRGRFVWTQAKLDSELLAGGRCFLRTRNFSLRALKAASMQGFKALSSLLTREVGTNEDASAELAAILGAEVGKHFAFPKPHTLIRTLLNAATHDKPEAVILDSFAGSGTTGHAVLALNKADGGRRRFVVVEMDPAICRRVTFPRLCRVIEGYWTKSADAKAERWVGGLGGSFRYCSLG
jgi:adenine-specific DNA-methyltransferase